MNGISVCPSALASIPPSGSLYTSGYAEHLQPLHEEVGADVCVTGLVHFAGFWNRDDEAVLGRAIAHIESRLDDVPDRTLGEPWVCTCQMVGEGRFYTAHRAGFERPVTGRSARQLSFRLYGAAHSLTG